MTDDVRPETFTWGDLLTEPLTPKEVAGWFRYTGTNAASDTIVPRLDGVIPFGKCYRIPLRHMPPQYFEAHGLWPPAETSRNLTIGRTPSPQT